MGGVRGWSWVVCRMGVLRWGRVVHRTSFACAMQARFAGEVNVAVALYRQEDLPVTNTRLSAHSLGE